MRPERPTAATKRSTNGEEIHERNREPAVRRRAAVRRTSGALTGVYPRDYLDLLRDEWPE
jgi:hypothetical protein